MRIINRFIQVLATGYILFYFSENLFWARLRPDNSVGDWLATWTAYSICAFIFLWVVSYFRVRSIWAVFLAGAVFGWVVEGIVEQTAYKILPTSISFTGLAWHALISVIVGWYGIRKVLQRNRLWDTARVTSLVGLAYGLWAIFWWIEPDGGGKASITQFAEYSLGATALAIIAYKLYDWSAVENYTPGLPGRIFVTVITLLYFVFVTIKNAPIALVILPVLLLIVYVVLLRNRKNEAAGSILSTKPAPVIIWNYLLLFLLPVTAIAFYSIAYAVNLKWQTNMVLYCITMPLGFIMFKLSIHKILKTSSKNKEIPSAQERISNESL